MLFNSLEFLAFFVAVFAAYALLRHRNQNRLLLVASYVFYGAWDYRFLALLIFSTVVDFYIALALDKTAAPTRRNHLLAISIAFNLGVLGFFKYFGFFAESLVDLASMLGLSVSSVTLNVILPVGISFYTFQSLSYTIDVYRRKLPACTSIADYALFVAFFPQLVAGPIERARRLLPQIQAPRAITAGKIGAGGYLILLGIFKKVVVADNLAGPVDTIFSLPAPTGEQVLIGSLYFAFQIYCDFSGYSDIARGLARTMGFELMVNFRQPFFTKNPSEFFRRWHISLSSWIRDYLFTPLGGISRNGFVTARNVVLTMVLVGLWHGAAWNFVLWGVYVSLWFVYCRAYDLFVMPHVDRAVAVARWAAPLRAAMAHLTMITFTLYGFMIFRAQSLGQITTMTEALAHFESLSTLLVMGGKFVVLASPVFLLDWHEFRRNEPESFTRSPLLAQVAAYTTALLLFITIGEFNAAAFIYFQF